MAKFDLSYVLTIFLMPVIVIYLFICPRASFDRYKEAAHGSRTALML